MIKNIKITKLKSIFYIVFMTIICFTLSINILYAKQYHRLEVELNYDVLKPENIYGRWKNLSIRYFHSLNEQFTYFVSLDGFSRKGGDALLFNGGIYKDFSDSFYIYTSIAFATKCDYLPSFRVDNDFNFKTGRDKNLVFTAGLSYLKYFDEHKDFIYSLGTTYYFKGGTIEYRHFFNKSDPGNIFSHTDLLSIGIGEEKKSWTYLDISYGSQAYLATYLYSPEEVRQKAFYMALKHRKWTTKDSGFFFSVNYLNLQDAYQKLGFSIGYFKEF